MSEELSGISLEALEEELRRRNSSRIAGFKQEIAVRRTQIKELEAEITRIENLPMLSKHIDEVSFKK